MRVSTTKKPSFSLDIARRIGNGSDFEVSETTESRIDNNGLLIFGPANKLEYTTEPTKIDISWSDHDREIRMKYMIEGGARGLLLSAFDNVTLPEKKFVCSAGMDGFEFTADANGSSYLFGKFSQEKETSEIIVDAWLPGLKTLHATRMTSFYIENIIGDVLKPLV